MKSKKKTYARRIARGYDAAPQSDFFEFKDYVRTDVDPKLISDTLKEYVKNRYDKQIQKQILAAPEWRFKLPYHIAASIEWEARDNQLPAKWNINNQLESLMFELMEAGKEEIQKKIEESRPVTVTKIDKKLATIFESIEQALDDFYRTGTLDFSAYEIMSKHMATAPQAKSVVDFYAPLHKELLAIKTDPDIAEGYAHLSTRSKNQYISLIKSIIDDAKKFSEVKKASRRPRVTKPKTIDSQLKNLQWMKESPQYKIASVDPKKIIGANSLLVFDTRKRIVIEYISASDSGFAVKGTTLQNVDFEKSSQRMVRKPDEFLTAITKTTLARTRKIISGLTTKPKSPNARINGDYILLKVSK